MEMFISDRNKLGLITGKIRQPILTDPTYSKWRIENAIIKGWIINSLNPDLIGNFIRFPTAKGFETSLPQPTLMEEIMSRYIT
jgi:hypothetical protein